MNDRGTILTACALAVILVALFYIGEAMIR